MQQAHRVIAYYCDEFVLPLPPGHRFPMAKYARLRERLLDDGVIAPDQLRVPDAATDAQLRLVHTREYVRRVVAGELTASEQRRLGFPWSEAMVERSRRSVGGTIGACSAALRDGIAVNLAGGTHHAFADRGEGFCVFNDAAVAARVCLEDRRVGRVAIIDCDVHQGNGTAAVFADEPRVFTFSIHGARNYPFEKQSSDLDIELDDGCGDAEYLARLAEGTRRVLEDFSPCLVIYLAGADPYEGDRFGRLALSREGLRARDELVLSACRRRGIPVAVVMAGGYAPNVEDIVDIHAATVRVAGELQSGEPRMSARYIEIENDRWEVKLGEHPAHPGVGTVLFFPRNDQRAYRVLEVPAGRFKSQDQLDSMSDGELLELFRSADVMDFVHENDAGGHHPTRDARAMPPDVGTGTGSA